MKALLDFLYTVDLAAASNEVAAFLRNADPYLVALVVTLFNLLGWKMASLYPPLRSWGLRLAAAVFLIHAGYAYFTQLDVTSQDLPRIGLNALIAANVTLAPMWTIVPVLFFIYGHLRVALAAFLLYGGWAVATAETLDRDVMTSIALRALLASGLALVVAWILQPVIDFLRTHLLSRLRPPVQPSSDKPVARETTAPAAEASPDPEAQAVLHGQRARVEAELLYSLHGPDIVNRLEHKILYDLFRRYLTDQQHPNEAEAPRLHLKAPMVPSEAAETPPQPRQELTELTRWFLAERKRVEGLAEPDRQRHLQALHERYQRLAERLLEHEAA